MNMMNLAFKAYLFLLLSDFFTCCVVLRHGATTFSSCPKEGVLRISIASAGFEPANRGSNGKHAKHYTTEATSPTYKFQVYIYIFFFFETGNHFTNAHLDMLT
jgi:hypothetical protein